MKKLIIPALAIAAILGTVGVAVAETDMRGSWRYSDHPRLNQLEDKASLFGISVDELQSKLEMGLTFGQIAEEQGMSPKEFHEQMQVRIEERLNTLVEDGVITSEQAQEQRERHEQRREERLSEAASALGISADELEKAHEDGQTIRGIAEEKGIDLEQFRAERQKNRPFDQHKGLGLHRDN